jgi:hydrogenase expression/formation protein HypD
VLFVPFVVEKRYMPSEAQQLAEDIAAASEGRPVRIMEICGTHTVSLFRTGARSMLPENLRLVSGPGCPVCVTSQAYIDLACDLAARDDVTIATYGDMVRVPGTQGSLETLRARGADVKIVYSARDALKIARENPARQVVFLAVGFETTAPATAATVLAAQAAGLDNLTILPGHKFVMPAMAALLADPDIPIDAFLCPGHVSVVLGTGAYLPVARDYHRPCVVAGFELENMLAGIAAICHQLAAGEARVENVYTAVVRDEGNPAARALIDRVFQPGDDLWRALGTIPDSGMALRDKFRTFDAMARFELTMGPDVHPPGCLCGEVIQGKVTPAECKLFATACTPQHPIGPCMVSSEGTCAAWFRYNRPR